MSRNIRPVGLASRRSTKAARSDAPNPAASPPGSQAISIAAYTTITGSSIPVATSSFLPSGLCLIAVLGQWFLLSG